MAILTSDDLYAGLSAAQRRQLVKASVAAVAGRTMSLWTSAGFPTAGAAPGAAAIAIPTSATTGALPFSNPGSGASYLAAAIGFSSTVSGTLIVYDRIAHSSALSGTVATAQTVGGSALTRGGDHIGTRLFLECYSALGASASNVTCSYTNQAGTSGRTTVSQAMIASLPANTLVPLVLQSGDTGVQAVASVTLSATTGTAGNFGVTLMRELARIPVFLANVPTSHDAIALGMPVIPDNACIAFAYVSTTTSTGVVQGLLSIAQG